MILLKNIKTRGYIIIFALLMILFSAYTYYREKSSQQNNMLMKIENRSEIMASVGNELLRKDLKILKTFAETNGNAKIPNDDYIIITDTYDTYSENNDIILNESQIDEIMKKNSGFMDILQNDNSKSRLFYYVLENEGHKTAICEEYKYSRIIDSNLFEFTKENSEIYMVDASGDVVYPYGKEISNIDLSSLRGNNGSMIIKKGNNSFVCGYCALDKEITGNLYYMVSIAKVGNIFSYSNTIVIKLITGFIILSILMLPYIIIHRRYVTTNNALETAEGANEAKKTFLSKFSHDIRTPMNAIIGMTDIAKESLDDKEEMAYCLSKIETSADYMLSMLTDILDISKIENGKMELERTPFSLNSIIKGVNSIMFVQANNKDVKFLIRRDISKDILLIGDKVRIRQILLNLLTNAVKFTTSGGKVIFSICEIEKTENDVTVEFSIKDNGVGMSSDFMKKMYIPFEREKNISSEAEGTGLGLPICYQLVKMMNGTIDVNSNVGLGTEFKIVISFPYIIDKMTENCGSVTVKNGYGKYDFSGKKILIADDNDTNLEITKKLLEDANAEVDIAVNGRDAVECFDRSAPGYYDCILLDVQMPVKNGLEAAEEIRKSNRPDALTIKIAAMTAYAFGEDIDKTKKSGMNMHIIKPIKRDVLYSKINFLLSM